MIPTYFVPLRLLPLTLNAKVDVKSLREPLECLTDDQRLAYSLRKSGRTGELDDNGLRLRDLSAGLLNISIDNFFVDSNFTASGGTGLTAMRLIAAARAQGFVLDFRSIMDAPSLLDMASEMKPTGDWRQSSNMLGTSKNGRPVAPVGKLRYAAKMRTISLDIVQDAYPCTIAQEELVSSSVTNPGSCITRT